MPTPVWTLTHNSVTKTLKEWGLSNVTRQRISQGMDTVEANLTLSRWDRDVAFSYRDAVTIQRDDATWFAGRVYQPSRHAPGASGQTYSLSLAGPWWDLERTPYFQNWKVWQSTALGFDYSGRCLLFWSGSGWITTGQQITVALNWAIARGVAIQVGSIATGMNVPINERRDLFVSEVIRECMRWHPDWVTWIDYTTTPPTFHAQPRSALIADPFADDHVKTVAAGPGTGVLVSEVTPRHDLQVPAVRITFERANSDNGNREFIVEVAPDGATGLEPGTIPGNVTLESPSGGNSTRVHLECETIDANSADTETQKSWWRRWYPGLNDPKITSFSISNVELDGETPVEGVYLPNALIEGQISGELTEQFSGEKQKWTALAAVNYDGHLATIQVSAEVTGTDAETGDYTTGAGDEEGEPYSQFTGLAAAVYAANSTLHYQGSITIPAQDLPAAADEITVGDVLNLSGTARSELATMNALVQSVTDTVDNGTRQIAFGPPGHLGPSDLIELIRSFRQRRRETPRNAQNDGTISATAPPQLGDLFAGGNTSAGPPTYSKITLGTGSGGTARTIRIDPSDLADGEVAFMREISYCDAGVTKKIKVLATELYV